MGLLRRRHRDQPEDPALAGAEQHVTELQQRARRVESVLRPRHDRNHWGETIARIYRGEAPA